MHIVAGVREGKLDVNPGWHSDSDMMTNSSLQMDLSRYAFCGVSVLEVTEYLLVILCLGALSSRAVHKGSCYSAAANQRRQPRDKWSLA